MKDEDTHHEKRALRTFRVFTEDRPKEYGIKKSGMTTLYSKNLMSATLLALEGKLISPDCERLIVEERKTVKEGEK